MTEAMGVQQLTDAVRDLRDRVGRIESREQAKGGTPERKRPLVGGGVPEILIPGVPFGPGLEPIASIRFGAVVREAGLERDLAHARKRLAELEAIDAKARAWTGIAERIREACGAADDETTEEAVDRVVHMSAGAHKELREARLELGRIRSETAAREGELTVTAVQRVLKRLADTEQARARLDAAAKRRRAAARRKGRK